MLSTRIRSTLSLGAIAGLTVAMNTLPMAPAHADSSTKQLQWNLAGLGYLSLSGVDGAMGPNTQTAIKHFQADQCLATDGIAGTRTNSALTTEVRQVQNAASVATDGAFGPNTKTAVATWQSQHRISADGIAGPQTESAMQITRARECNVPTGTPSPGSSATTQAQWDLAGMGYLPWSGIDGQVGPQTISALEAFQSDRCLASDGVLGPNTNAALSSVTKQVQAKVGSPADGAFGPSTKTAVAAWQRAHSLNADGQAGAETMQALGVARHGSCSTPPTTPAPTPQTGSIPGLASAELANNAHNHEIGGYNCNYYTASFKRGSSCGNGFRTEAWCADFAGWIWLHAGVNTAGLNAEAGSFYVYGKRYGTLHTSNPKVGDAVVYGIDSSGTNARHVGLVVSVSGASYTVIAGNAGSGSTSVHRSTGTVGSGGVSGFVSPVKKG